MNSYIWIHRIKGPAMLLVFGITALLDEWDILSYGKSWPLYLIVLGVLQLAERAAWTQYQQAQAAEYGAQPYPGQPYSGQPYPGRQYSAPANPGTAMMVPPPSDLERR